MLLYNTKMSNAYKSWTIYKIVQYHVKYVKYYTIIYFFFLYREHILTFMVGLFCKKLTAKSSYFCKKAIDF